MNIGKQKLLLSQLDKKLHKLKPLANISTQRKGWISTARKALHISMRQLAARMGTSAQSVNDLEKREVNGAVTINSLKAAAAAMDMRLVYAFVPNEKSLQALIEKRAFEIATEIVGRSAATMQLEDQTNSNAYIKRAIKQKAAELCYTLPKELWD